MKKAMTHGFAAMFCTVGALVFAPTANAQCDSCGPVHVAAPGYEGPVCDSTLWDECDVDAYSAGGGAGAGFGGFGAGGGGCGNWFFAMNGLVFNRDYDDNQMLTFDTFDGEPLLYTRSAENDWAGGFEARFGRYFNCGRNAIEASYWGIFPDRTSATFLAADAVGLLNTPLLFDSLTIDPAGLNLNVADFYNGAELHQVRRTYEVHNIEVNLLTLAGSTAGFFHGAGPFGAFGGGGGGGGCSAYAGDGCSAGSCGACASCDSCASGGGPACGTSCGCGGGGGMVFTLLAGPRFLRFREDMLFATDLVDTTFTGTAEELAYLIDVENNLLGFQLGGRADMCFGSRFSGYAGLKMGLYANDMQHHQHIRTGNGLTAEVNDVTSPFDGEVYDINSSRTDVSMIGELDLGLNYRVTNCWSANVGYRAVAVSGIALAPSQIPTDFFDNLQAVRSVNSNGNLILHGGYAGLTFNY